MKCSPVSTTSAQHNPCAVRSRKRRVRGAFRPAAGLVKKKSLLNQSGKLTQSLPQGQSAWIGAAVEAGK
jgi:hypothetical protein